MATGIGRQVVGVGPLGPLGRVAEGAQGARSRAGQPRTAADRPEMEGLATTMGYGYGFGGLVALFMMLFWVFVVAAIVWLVLWVTRSQGWRDDRAGSARRILEERLARGEIDAEGFRARRAALEETKR